MNNRSPSHATVDEAAEELECFPESEELPWTSDCQRSFPVCRSRQRTDCACLAGSAVAMAKGNAAQARSAMVREAQAQAMSAKIVLFIIRFTTASLAKIGRIGK